MKELLYILKLTEKELKIMLYNYLVQKKMLPVFEDGFVYAKGNIPILLVAHMDTVFDKPPKDLYYDKESDAIFSCSGGIGGDDRCGVYAIMKILERFKPHVLFTEAEEMGGIGAQKAVEKLVKPDVKYIIEFDRQGNNDCVFYECGNTEFINYIESFGFITAQGSFSDISILGSEWDIAAVNLSSGYYNEHTDNEYIIFKELQNNIKRVKSILRKHKKAKYFDYQEIPYSPSIFEIFDDLDEDALMFWLEKYYNSMHEEEQNNGGKKLSRKKDNLENKKDDK